MAIEHTFRTVGGELKTSTLTPIRAIREHCVECIQSRHEDCTSPLCALYPFRRGDAHAVTPEQRAQRARTAKERIKTGG